MFAGRGGALARVERQSDGSGALLCGALDGTNQEALTQHFEAEISAAKLHPALVPALERLDEQRRSWLVYGDISGQPLDVSEAWNLERFWGFATQLALVLAEAHRNGLVHGRLDAKCVWWSGDSAKRPVLLGLVLVRDAKAVHELAATVDTAPELLTEPRASVAPTADVYSLGSVFYRMLAGRSAITSTSNLAFDVASIAPARLERSGVCSRLGSLVLAMLSKAPAARPASAQEVYEELEAIRGGGEPAHRLSFQPPKLIGRVAEMELLLKASHSAKLGLAALVCIEGGAGVGKSHLLEVFVSRLPRQGFLVGRGKFEQSRLGQPYSALLSGCRAAIGSVLSSEDGVFLRARRRLVAASPTLLGVVAQHIPELRHLCGELPAPSELGPAETRNRFNRASLELLSAMCDQELPFVLVLDDVQWADDATVALMTQLVTAGLPDHLLVVLSCRTEGRNATLDALLELIPAQNRVRLDPFPDGQTEEFCRSVVTSCDGFPSLAETVQQRSGGNALYCIELLRSLVANGQLARVGDHWAFSQRSAPFKPLSETVIDLIRERFAAESDATKYTMGAAAFIGSVFSRDLLGVATDFDPETLERHLGVAVRQGLVDVKPDTPGLYVFSHDRIQETALASLTDDDKALVHLRLGRHYRTLAHTDQFALFHCLDHLNAVRAKLSPAELLALYGLNLDAAKQARRAIAYQRASELLGVYLEGALEASERFDAMLLLGECLLLASGARCDPQARIDQTQGERALEDCEALAVSQEQRLRLLQLRLALGVYNQDYERGVEHGLAALHLLGHPLPGRPSALTVLFRALHLAFKMGRIDVDALSQLREPPPNLAFELSILGWLSACAHWTRPNLGALVLIRVAELTIRYRDNPRSAMGFACYSTICHLQGKYPEAIRAGRVAAKLSVGQDIQTRSMVRFIALTFYGAFEQPPAALIASYDDALADCVSHGDLTASHLMDAAVTMLPYTGWGVPRTLEALAKYEREARLTGATTTLEAIGFTRSWCQLLQEDLQAGADAVPQTLFQPLQHSSFTGARDVMRMQIEYLRGNYDEVLAIGRGVRRHTALRDSPFFLSGYSTLTVLAASRLEGKHRRRVREAFGYLRKLEAVCVDGAGPGTFAAHLLLAKALQPDLPGEARETLLERAVEEAARTKQELLKAMCQERLAVLCASRGDYSLFVEHMRDAAQTFHRFGAKAKAQAIITDYPGIDWSHLAGRGSKQVGVQVEGVMRAASAIAEVTSTEQLGPTLLRVIATTANAMRSFLFLRQEGKLVLVAGCERDQADSNYSPTPLDAIETTRLGLRAVRYVERTRDSVELPRDSLKFEDDEYLARRSVLRGILCVPLTYRGDLVGVLYLEGSCNAEHFSQDEAMLVTLLGRQAAIALSNTDMHRFEIEALQSKVNPHFLYNALSVVSDLVHRDPDAAEGAVLKLTKLYRYMLSTPANSRVSLDKELELVRDYLELEKLRFGRRLEVVWDIAANVSSVLVPALLIQPLAENAVNHGVRRNKDGGTVTIAVEERDDVLVLTVSDNGPGWYEGRGGTGFGLRSVRRRLELMYGDRAQLAIVKRSDGVSVSVTLPW